MNAADDLHRGVHGLLRFPHALFRGGPFRVTWMIPHVHDRIVGL